MHDIPLTSRKQIIETGNVRTFGKETFAKMGPQKPCATSNKNSFFIRTTHIFDSFQNYCDTTDLLPKLWLTLKPGHIGPAVCR
jgi:hypothetical protein